MSAIEPVLRGYDGVWMGWPGGTDQDLEPFEDDGLALVPLPMSAEDVEGHYEGFSNATLWPLYHDLVAKPEFHREWWESYVEVNERFAAAAANEAAEHATVWIHDYQLQLMPRMLRELRPDLRIGFYLHIPFPPAELFQQLPWRRQILEGLLGADLVGFQLPGGAQNFVRLVRQLVGHKTHRDLVYLPDGRTVRAAAFPISIDAAGFEALATSPQADGPRGGDPRPRWADPRRVFLGVRPARLHQGHLRPPARVQRAHRRRALRRRGRRVHPGGGPVARAGRAVPDPPRRDRAPGRPDQRRARPDRPAGGALPAHVAVPRGDGRASTGSPT